MPAPDFDLVDQFSADNHYLDSIFIGMGSRLPEEARFAQFSRQDRADAEKMVDLLVGAGMRKLVYGGGMNGTMGVVARRAQYHGLAITAISSPEFFAKEKEEMGEGMEVKGPPHGIIHVGARKHQFLIDGKSGLYLPGGIGTFGEIFHHFEEMDARRIRKNSEYLLLRPAFLLNRGGFFDPLFQLLANAMERGKAHPEQVSFVRAGSTPESLTEIMVDYNQKGPQPLSKLNSRTRQMDALFNKWMDCGISLR
jgi:predicted Rossmann-fold nucleotide-binding protein